LGITSLAGQVVLLREYLAVFYGNEIVYALILAAWLGWVAAGSFTASRIVAKIRVILLSKFTAGVFAAIAFLLPVTVLLIRSIKPFLKINPGELIGIPAMALAAIVTLFPLAFSFGTAFPFLCRWRQSREPDDDVPGGVIYIWESLGAAIGGVALTFVLLHFWSGWQIAWGLGILVLVVCLCLITRKQIALVSGIVLALLVFLPGGIAQKSAQMSYAAQWPKFKVVTDTDSVYGRITVVRYGDEYSLYANGFFSFTAGDVLNSEERVHFAMLAQGNPRRVLLIGGGIGGALAQILKYPQTTVDYVELDPKVILVSKQFLPAQYTGILAEPRVNTFIKDGRFFVKTAQRKYDAVIVAVGDPATALLNRYYTREFFGEVRRILVPGGVLGLSVSSSENYLNEATKSFLRSINTTLKQEFLFVQAIPGGTNTFVAGDTAIPADAGFFVRRLKEAGISNKYISAGYLPFRLSADRIDYIRKVLSIPGRVNTDEKPIAFFYDAVLWSTHFEAGYKKVLEKLAGLKFWQVLVLPLLVFLTGVVWRGFSKTGSIKPVIMTSGFSQIIFQVLILLSFQTIFGYSYQQAGILLGMFMLGLVLGGIWAARAARGKRINRQKMFKGLQLGMVLYPFVFPLIFGIVGTGDRPGAGFVFLGLVFLMLPVLVGVLGGAQYVLGVKLLSAGGRGNGGDKAGELYAWDVLGAAVGAILAGMILIPVLGINAVAVLTALMSLAALVWIF